MLCSRANNHPSCQPPPLSPVRSVHRCMHKPFVFVPLLVNCTRRVTLGEYLCHLTKNPIVDCPLKSKCPWEKSHTAAINIVRHPVDGNGRLLPFLPLPGKEAFLASKFGTRILSIWRRTTKSSSSNSPQHTICSTQRRP